MREVYENRQDELFERLPGDVGSVILPPGKPLTYFAGIPMTPLEEHGSERVFFFILTRDGDSAFVLPELETNRVPENMEESAIYTYEHTSVSDPLAVAREAFEEFHSDFDVGGQVATGYRYTRLLEYSVIASAFGWEDVVDLGRTFSEMRVTKDGEEIENLQKAGEIIDECLEATLREIEPGMTEAEVESQLKQRILASEADMWGVTLVLSGARTAEELASTTDRRIEEGDMVMIDTGAVYEGYYSDITRTAAVGEPDRELLEIYDVVYEANQRAHDAVREGATGKEADAAAREIIEDAGYGDAFNHRVGHGIGLDGHEPPYLGPANEEPLEAGTTFTIEPGIYLEGLGGVRIEDNVAITDDGPKVLTDTSRDLLQL